MNGHFSIICVNSVLYGFGKGLFWSLRGPVLAEIIPSEDFDRALGTEQFFTGFLMLLCPLQGKLYDITGDICSRDRMLEFDWETSRTVSRGAIHSATATGLNRL